MRKGRSAGADLLVFTCCHQEAIEKVCTLKITTSGSTLSTYA